MSCQQIVIPLGSISESLVVEAFLPFLLYAMYSSNVVAVVQRHLFCALRIFFFGLGQTMFL